jgi:hypothetical protein
MKKLATLLIKSALVATCVAGIAACGGDDDAPTADASVRDDASAGYVCDPEGANPEMGMLLNAPLDSDVEVINKTPQHPGDPGPKDLP